MGMYTWLSHQQRLTRQLMDFAVVVLGRSSSFERLR